MRNSKKLYLVIILILSISLIFTACSNDSSSPNIDNKNTYTISGAVIGLENEGIKDVVLHFSNDDESVKTNSAGEWQKSDLSGEVEVTPVKEGYEFSPKSKKVSRPSDEINFTVQNFIIIPETTKIINDESSLQIEQLTDNQVIMNKNNDFVESVKVNDILVSGVTDNTPFGMLRQVESKTVKGDSIVFQTSMASLDQAIRKGNIHKEIILKQQDVITNEVLSSGVNIEAANNFSKEFSYQLDKIIYDNDGNHDTEYDQVVTKGSVAFGYKLILDMEIDSFKLKSFSIKSMVEGDQYLSISSGVSYSKDEDFRIAEIKFAPMTFPIPIPFGAFPLVITPNLGVDIGYSGSISSEVVTSTSLSQTIEGGANYNSSGWEPIKNLDLDHDFETPSLETGANFAIAAGPELTTMVYELAGPSSKIEGYSQLEADPLEEIWWELYGGINGSVGVKIEVFSVHIADYEKVIIDYRKLLAETNAVPVINSIDDKKIKEGEKVEFKVSASDPNGDKLKYSASGDLTEKFNNETQIFSWTSVKGEAGNYKINFEVSDGKESDSESVNITVNENLENSPPVIDDLTNNISEFQVTISAKVNDIDDNLSEVRIDWGDENKSNINSGFDNINESHTYANEGSYIISLTAVDDVGATASESLTVTVSKTNEPPIIDLSTSTDKLTATISGSITDSDGSISSSEIDWGDGNTTNIDSGFDNINETHTYTSGGTYNVSVSAVDNDSSAASENLILPVSETKEAKWTFKTGGNIFSSPAIGEDGTIYVGGEDTNLYAVNPDGTEKWSFETDDRIRSTPAIGKDDTIYFGSHDHNLYAVYTDGTEKWKLKTGENIYCSPTMAEDGTIYIGSYDNKLYAIEGDSNGLANSPWPKFRNNNRNTGKEEF